MSTSKDPSKNPPKYNKKDMKSLEQLSETSSILKFLLKKVEYDPIAFSNILKERRLKKDHYFLFEMPLNDLMLNLHDTSKSGYITFRVSVGK
jgi:hypothetical protein